MKRIDDWYCKSPLLSLQCVLLGYFYSGQLVQLTVLTVFGVLVSHSNSQCRPTRLIKDNVLDCEYTELQDCLFYDVFVLESV